MKLLTLICSTLLGYLFMANTTLANATEVVTCPSVDKIRQAASSMTKATYSRFDKTYTVTALTAVVDNNREWKLGSLFIRAHSLDEARTIGQNRAATASQVLYQSASVRDSTYLCLYYDGSLQSPYVSIMATSAMSAR